MTSRRGDSRALALAVEYLEGQRDEAARASAHARDAARDAHATLRTLGDYRNELVRRRRDGTGVLAHGANGLANASAFSLRLDEAFDAQAKRVEEREQTEQDMRSVLIAQQRRLKALEWLIERRSQEARARLDKRERIENEEWTNARFAGKERTT